MASRSKSVSAKHQRIKLFQQPTNTKEIGMLTFPINLSVCLDGVLISSSNAKRLDRELKVLSQMVDRKSVV